MPFDVDAALAAGYSQDEINQYLRSQQLQGAMRYPAMLASEALSGAESLESVPAKGVNWLTSAVNPLLGTSIPQIPDVEQYTNKIGLTNNQALIPGYGPYPQTEQLLAAGARGLGAAAPMALMGGIPAAAALGAGAAGGVAGEATHQAFPGNSWLPAAVGGTVGLLGGGVAAGLSSPATASDIYQGVTDALGSTGATPYSAGREIQTEIQKANVLGATGLGPGTALPASDIKRLLNAKPSQVTDMVLKDPDVIQTLRTEMPATVDQLAGAMIGRSAPQWNRLQPEVQQALIPDAAQQGALKSGLDMAKASGAQGGNTLWRYIVGGGTGVALSHMGLLPGGDIMGSIVGEAGAEMLHRTMTNSAAKAILGPVLNPTPLGFRAGASAGLGALGGSNPGNVEPPLGFAVAPGQ